MRVLALDTTTLAGSVALIVDDRIVDERAGDRSRPHAERLPGELVDLVCAHHLTLADVDLFAVASGPGSFTGMRIGIATVQGAAFVHGRGVVGVPALEAMAQIGSRGRAAGEIVAAWMDAHRHEVFAALYRVSGAPELDLDRLEVIEAPVAADPTTLMARWTSGGHRPDVFVGDGAEKYRDVIGPASMIAMPVLAGAIG